MSVNELTVPSSTVLRGEIPGTPDRIGVERSGAERYTPVRSGMEDDKLGSKYRLLSRTK